MSIATSFFPPPLRGTTGIVCPVGTVIVLWQAAREALRDPYRPERHYMRGPGPKWRERHANTSGERRGMPCALCDR